VTSLADQLFAAPLGDFRRAARRIRGDAIVSPLLKLDYTGLKAECLQPMGSFKVRGAANAIASLPASLLENGIVTASAGNFAQGLALAARRRGLAITVHAPDTAATSKIASLDQLGATIVTHDFAGWWRILSTREAGGAGHFIHPVAEAGVILGNGSIALEIMRQDPDIETVFVPIGGGGLCAGIALAFRAAGRRVRIIGCEIETSTPLAQARAAGQPVEVDRGPSWVDGIGGRRVLDDMWPLLNTLVDDVVVVSTADAEAAFCRLAREAHLVVEGAGAVAFAAASAAPTSWGRSVAVLSGGNIDAAVIARLMTKSA
jgi:threonine dehydratase